ncbi:MAG: histidine kinase [Gemmatimonadaceae bacterium]
MITRQSDLSSSGPHHVPTLAGRVLRLSLVIKLIGANAVVAILAIVAAAAVAHDSPSARGLFIVLGSALAIGLLVNVALVSLALRPIRDLQRTTLRISNGDYSARVPVSPLADSELERIGHTLNQLLDNLIHDRERMRELAKEIIRTGDQERVALARELHDSVAQELAALSYQLASLEQASAGSSLHEQTSELRNQLNRILEEVRLLSQNVHPRVLVDLGLVAGLRYLARTISESTGLPISVSSVGDHDRALAIVPESASVLYRVAHEAVQNAVRHSLATKIEIHVLALADSVSVRVTDDGIGFDLQLAEQRAKGRGIFTMRERVSLAGGNFALEEVLGGGISVKAIVPLSTLHHASDVGSLTHSEEPSGRRNGKA